MAFTQVAVVGTFTTADGGDPARGRIRFTPTETLINDGVTIVASPVTATLDPAGEISLSLAATDGDDGTVTPSGAPAYYLVEELLFGQRSRSWRITVPTVPSTGVVWGEGVWGDPWYAADALDLADVTPE